MRPALRSLAALLSAVLLTACGREAAPVHSDVVLIVIDTLRADHADSALGHATTPAIDALAADGVRFEQALSHSPMTLPSHASLFASLHPWESGVKLNAQIVPDMPLLTGWLARFGYRTAAVVSLSSLWPYSSGTSLQRGFEQFVYDGLVDCWPGDRVDQELQTVLDSLEGAEEPFFLFAHFQDPHDPYDSHGTVERYVDVLLDGRPLERMLVSEFAFRSGEVTLAPGPHALEFVGDHDFLIRMFEPRGPQGVLPFSWEQGEFWTEVDFARIQIDNTSDEDVVCDLWMLLGDALTEEENRARYRLETEFVDAQVGRFIESLKRRGLYDDALILLTSDHGEALGEHGLTGHVDTLYDELLRVPLVVKLPAGHAAGEALQAASGRLTGLIDLAPTTLELLQLPPMPGQRGTSVLSQGPARPVLAETHRPIAPRELWCLRDTRRKLIYAPKSDTYEMYDLMTDPAEERDVFDLRGAELLEWQRELERIAAASAAAGTAQPILDHGAAQRIKALGY